MVSHSLLHVFSMFLLNRRNILSVKILEVTNLLSMSGLNAVNVALIPVLGVGDISIILTFKLLNKLVRFVLQVI